MALTFLIAHNGTDTAAAGTGPALRDRSLKKAVFTGQADGRHLGLGLPQFLADQTGHIDRSLACQMGGVPDFHLFVMDSDVNLIQGFTPQDRFIAPGILHSGTPPPIMEKASDLLCGEMVDTIVRLQPMAGVPHKRAAPKISRFSSANGSTFSEKGLSGFPVWFQSECS